MLAELVDHVVGVDPDRDWITLAVLDARSAGVVAEPRFAATGDGYGEDVDFVDGRAPVRSASTADRIDVSGGSGVEPTWEMVRAEQRQCAALFRGIDRDEWEMDTLCAGWTVRDMLSHVASTIVMDPAHAVRIVRFRNDIDRLNQTTIDAWRDRSADSLIGRIERAATPSIGQRIIGAGSSLRGLMIHQQDMRRPLGRAFRLDPDRLRVVLDAVLTGAGGNIGSVERSDALRLVADDIEWSHGSGPEVHGPGEAILMALAGRKDGLNQLTGPGTELLAERC